MIVQDIEFLRPHSIAEAVEAFRQTTEAGLNPEYFSGGTELVTMARDGKVSSRAFIDLKRIPETVELGEDKGVLRLPGCLPLNSLCSAVDYPLFSRCTERLADHTVRNSITLSGNVAGRLPYRESMLPLLLADANAIIATGEGEPTKKPLRELFDKRLRLPEGGFIVAFEVDRERAGERYWYQRWVRSARVDYPIVTLACVRKGGKLLFGVSGAFAYPVWGDMELSTEDITGVVDELGRIKEGARASAAYRKALLVRGITEARAALA